ncbi:MAG: phosphate acyltransferase PlsX [Lachnospiraceae bacterium]|nr:phosphate acyltransferase PlsX [Lachnospiraceae bacterium]
MAEIRIAFDAMGGDYAPAEIVKGAVEAANNNPDVKMILVGDQDAIKNELTGLTYNKDQVTIKHASEVITCEEAPVAAVRSKKDSSLVVAAKMLKTGEADAMISAGSTGAVLVGGQLMAGKIRGIKRAPLATMFPNVKGASLLLDCGANVDARPEHLVQFAKMGTIYLEHVVGVKNPKVGLVNIGVEEEKGNALVKETYPLLKETEGINFGGYVEARDVFDGEFDIILAEAFVGNVILKEAEGLANTIVKLLKQGLMSNLRSKMGAALAMPAIKETLKVFDASEYGGAPLLGLNGLVVKMHGNSTAKEVQAAVRQCINFKEQGINDKIREQFKK